MPGTTPPAPRGFLAKGAEGVVRFWTARQKGAEAPALAIAGSLVCRRARKGSGRTTEGGASHRWCRFNQSVAARPPQPERGKKSQGLGEFFFRKGAPGQLKSLGTDASTASWSWACTNPLRGLVGFWIVAEKQWRCEVPSKRNKQWQCVAVVWETFSRGGADE